MRGWRPGRGQGPSQGKQPTLRIFLSYRRDDTSGHAGRLYDALTERFGPGQVFMDIDTLEPGVPFDEVINQALERSDAFICLIGRRWLTVADAEGKRRIDDRGDFVRMEVERALARPEVRVIPALVQGATVPTTEDLPDSLAPLARRHAMELTDTRWRYDVDQLLALLSRLGGVEERPAVREGLGPEEPARRPRWLRIALPLAALLAAGALVLALAPWRSVDPSGVEAGRRVLAFSRAGPDGSGDIWVMDGAEPRQLTSGPHDDLDPRWLPDGRIGFTRWAEGMEPAPYVVPLGGGRAAPLEVLPPVAGAWDWRRDRIAYENPDDQCICVIDASGAGAPERLGDLGPGEDVTDLRWSPDGGAVAMTIVDLERPTQEELLWVLDTRSGDRRRMTSEQANGFSWSPASDALVAGQHRPGTGSDIVLISLDRDQITAIAQTSSEETDPSWSPDGERIAYVRLADGRSEIWTMDPSGGRPSPLTGRADRASGSGPAWAVDPGGRAAGDA